MLILYFQVCCKYFLLGSRSEETEPDVIDFLASFCLFVCLLQIATQTLWNIRIIVLAKPEHENRISHIFCDSVKTGIANALGQVLIPDVIRVLTLLWKRAEMILYVIQGIKAPSAFRLCLTEPRLAS